MWLPLSAGVGRVRHSTWWSGGSCLMNSPHGRTWTAIATWKGQPLLLMTTTNWGEWGGLERRREIMVLWVTGTKWTQRKWRKQKGKEEEQSRELTWVRWIMYLCRWRKRRTVAIQSCPLTLCAWKLCTVAHPLGNKRLQCDETQVQRNWHHGAGLH